MSYARFLLIDGMFEGGRMFVGATSVTYLLANGVSLSQIAMLKSVQAMTFLVCEVPTGVLADFIGRKNSLLAAVASAIAGFALFYLGHDFTAFAVAEVLCALALCFWSGAFEAFAIEGARLETGPGRLDRFFHLNQSINSSATLICGLVGGWLGSRSLEFPYLVAIMSFVVMGIVLALTPEVSLARMEHAGATILERWKLRFGTHLRATFREGLLHPALLPYFAAAVLVQFSIQPLLHYWQPFFTSLDPDAGAARNGLVFALYCGTSVVLGLAYAKVSHRAWARAPIATLLLFALFGISYLATAFAPGWLSALACFCLLQGVLAVSRTALSVRMNELIDSRSRASVLSSVSLVSRLGMMAALFVIARVGSNGAAAEPRELFRIFAWCSLGLVGLVAVGAIARRRLQVRAG